MQFYDGCSDGTFEMAEDWLVECFLCGQQYRIDRRSLNISVMEQGDVFEHYFWTELTCKGCGEKLFIRTKVYGDKNGDFIREDHECDDVDFIRPPDIRTVNQAGLQNNRERLIRAHVRNPHIGGRRMREIEIWADSFHEGVWCCDNICAYLESLGYSFESDYLNGFIPHYVVEKEGEQLLELIVYGSYKSWNPMPSKIKELIGWGKPDFVAYDAQDNRILFAVEETAATPTGNQAMQRCERQYGSAHLRIPYWYFVSEYGEHVDGGVRRDNIWPSIAAIKLTLIKKTPCLVLHYSDIDNVEDYNSGNGLGLLFSSLSHIIDNYVCGRAALDDTEELLARQYQEMLLFISSQWENVIDFIPSERLLHQDETAKAIARYALGDETPEYERLKAEVLVWPLTTGVPSNVLRQQQGRSLIKYDALVALLERDITLNKCYILSNNAGSGKPTTRDKISGWINDQAALFASSAPLNPPAVFTMKIEDFPETDNGNIHVTTSKNIVYLYDRWADLKEAIEEAYPRLRGKLNDIPDEKPVFMYVSNSLKPGRLFGDPFTGQLSAYSTCFGKFDTRDRAVIAYFPHQVHTQAFGRNGRVTRNKGTTLYTELTDYLIFNAGVAVSLKNEEVL